MCWCHVPLPIHRTKWWKAAGTPGMIISTLCYPDTQTQVRNKMTCHFRKNTDRRIYLYIE